VSRTVIKNISAERGDVNIVVGSEIGASLAEPSREAIWPAGLEWERVVWRHELARTVDEFLDERRRGYFVLEGVAGVGKTTFAASLARRRNWPAYVVGRGPKGSLAIASAASSLAAQAVHLRRLDRSRLEPLAFRSATSHLWQELFDITADSRDAAHPLVLVIDGLDEDEHVSGRNALGLPDRLPDHVYIVATQRPGKARLRALDKRTMTVDQLGEENQAALRRYLGSSLDRSDLKLVERERATDVIAAKAGGIWIYAQLVVDDLLTGRRDWRSLAELPNGLWQYYASTWMRFREDAREWRMFYLPVIATLAAVPPPYRPEQIAELSGIDDAARICRLLEQDWTAFLRLDERAGGYYPVHQSVVAFLTGEADLDALSHDEQLFVRDLAGAAAEAHRLMATRIVDGWGGIENGLPVLMAHLVENQLTESDGYGVRNLVGHLIAANCTSELHALLSAIFQVGDGAGRVRSRGSVWFLVHDRTDGLEGFATDIERAWRLLPKGDDPSLILQHLRYALILATVATSAQSLPSTFLVALVRKGVWSLERAVSYVHRTHDPGARARALLRLSDLMTSGDAARARSEARYLAERVLNDDEKLSILCELLTRTADDEQARRLVDEAYLLTRHLHNGNAARLALASRVSDEAYEQALREALLAFSANPDAQAPHSGWLFREAVGRGLVDPVVDAVPRIDNSFVRATTCFHLALMVGPPLRETLVDQGREAIAQLTTEERPAWHRAEALLFLAPLVAEGDRGAVLDEVEALLRQAPRRLARFEHENEDIARAVEAFASSSPNDDRYYIARAYRLAVGLRPEQAEEYGKRALAATAGIPDPTWRFDALTDIASEDRFPDETRRKAAETALEALVRLETRGDFLALLPALVPHLDDRQLRRVLSAARWIGDAPLRNYVAVKVFLAAAESADDEADGRALTGLACGRLGSAVNGYRRAELIEAMASSVSRKELKTLLAAALAIDDGEWRAVALCPLAPLLPPRLAKTARKHTRQITKARFRVPLEIALDARVAEVQPSAQRRAAATALTRDLRQLAETPLDPTIRVGGSFLDPFPESAVPFRCAVGALVELNGRPSAELLEAVLHNVDQQARAAGLTELAARAGDDVVAMAAAALRSCPAHASDLLTTVGPLPSASADELGPIALAIEDEDEAAACTRATIPWMSLGGARATAHAIAGDRRISFPLAVALGDALQRLSALGARDEARALAAGLLRWRARRRLADWCGRLLISAHLLALTDDGRRRDVAGRLRLRALRAVHNDVTDFAALPQLCPEAAHEVIADMVVTAADRPRSVSSRYETAATLLSVLPPGAARRRTVTWAARDILGAPPETRLQLLASLLEHGETEMLEFDAWQEAWACAAAAELPPNRLAALRHLAGLGKRDPTRAVSGFLSALPTLSEEGRPSLLLATLEVAPLLARALPGRACEGAVVTIDRVAWTWP
jgi:hypothetical protein